MDLNIGGQVTWAAVIQALASLIGFFVIGYQVIHLRRNIRGATQDRVYAHYMECCKLMMQKPQLYPYFYEDRELPTGTENTLLRQEISILAESFFGVIEHSCVQKSNMPKGSWAGCWLPYAKERINRSPAMLAYFNANKGWYTKLLCDVFEEVSNNPPAQVPPVGAGTKVRSAA